MKTYLTIFCILVSFALYATTKYPCVPEAIVEKIIVKQQKDKNDIQLLLQSINSHCTYSIIKVLEILELNLDQDANVFCSKEIT